MLNQFTRVSWSSGNWNRLKIRVAFEGDAVAKETGQMRMNCAYRIDCNEEIDHCQTVLHLLLLISSYTSKLKGYSQAYINVAGTVRRDILHEKTRTRFYQQICVKLSTYADYVALPAFARRMHTAAADRRPCSNRRSISPVRRRAHNSKPAADSGFAAVGQCWDRQTDAHQ